MKQDLKARDRKQGLKASAGKYGLDEIKVKAALAQKISSSKANKVSLTETSAASSAPATYEQSHSQELVDLLNEIKNKLDTMNS